MEELKLYVRGADPADDQDFRLKSRYGKVWFYSRNLYVRKGLKWYYCPLGKIVSIETMRGSRQLRQCCGAPIYREKMLRLTTYEKEHIYLTVEETENEDLKHTERLVKKISSAFPQIEILS